MRISDPSDRDLAFGRAGQPFTGSVVPGMCPRMHWHSMNPAIPPPDSLRCLLRGPDCCATSAAIDLRRVA
jgi:hypothetical protein